MADELVPYNKREITKKAELAGEGEKAIGQLYVYANEVFREATGRVVEKTNAIQDDQHFQFAASFAHESTKAFGSELLNTYNEATSEIRRVVREPLSPPAPPPEPKPALPSSSPPSPPPRQPTVERRKLTWGERISGETWIVRD